jgi:hypothetical protein
MFELTTLNPTTIATNDEGVDDIQDVGNDLFIECF